MTQPEAPPHRTDPAASRSGRAELIQDIQRQHYGDRGLRLLMERIVAALSAPCGACAETVECEQAIIESAKSWQDRAEAAESALAALRAELEALPPAFRDQVAFMQRAAQCGGKE